MSRQWFQIFILSLILTACGDESKEATNDISETNNPDERAELKNTPPDNKWTVCSCIEAGTDIKTCETKALEFLNPAQLIANDCYQRPLLKEAAQDMCDCINSIHQVSLKCDELQRTFDDTFDSKEQSIIQAYFDEMDCSE
jgi:hypothetical protein